MKFSVLMSVYYREKGQYLHEAIESIWSHQTMRPSEIVVVKDGPLNDELEEVLSFWQSRLQNKLRIVALDKNVGLGRALNHGLANCSYDIVARMDSDDISVPERFEKQITYMLKYGVDVVGSSVMEFDPDGSTPKQARRVPLDHKEIEKFAKFRNPMNHPTVVFMKYAVESVGGYRDMPGFEDYDLWVRLLQKKYVFANINENLVLMRAGNSQVNRRRGMAYVLSEFLFQNHLLRAGFINPLIYAVNLILRLPPRLLPRTALATIYRLLRVGIHQ